MGPLGPKSMASMALSPLHIKDEEHESKIQGGQEGPRQGHPFRGRMKAEMVEPLYFKRFFQTILKLLIGGPKYTKANTTSKTKPYRTIQNIVARRV